MEICAKIYKLLINEMLVFGINVERKRKKFAILVI